MKQKFCSKRETICSKKKHNAKRQIHNANSEFSPKWPIFLLQQSTEKSCKYHIRFHYNIPAHLYQQFSHILILYHIINPKITL